MTNPNDTYTSPLATRNASEEMLRLWSPRHKFNTWRRVWLAVAEAQHEVTKDWGASDPGGAARRAAEPDSSSTPEPMPKGGGRGGEGGDGSASRPTEGPLVTREQVEELRAVVERVNDDGTVGITDEEIARASEIERELRHDVMAHVHCLGEQCPKAKGIIHLGCTSQDVVCNADLDVLEDSLCLIREKLGLAILALGNLAERTRGLPCLAFTHYQPAQPTTVGRRAAMWARDLDYCEDRLSTGYPLAHQRGLRGATGTQASFLKLLGDPALMDELEFHWYRSFHGSLIGEDGGATLATPCNEVYEHYSSAPLLNVLHERLFDVTGQTYPRVIDTFILADLASVASVLHKIATDIRLLSNRKEIDEPFGSKQIGSSAMPYKRNPMRCERICGLTRFVMNLVGNAYDTAATQWLERTLDDSSNRRLSLPEAFLALDGALDLMHNVASGLVVHEAMVRKNLMAELPFLATENILMEAVKAGGDRQDLHERIRVHAQEAGHRVKHLGLDNDLIDRLRNDPAFAAVHGRLTDGDLLDPMRYVGRSVEQTERFIAEVIEPLRERYSDDLTGAGDSEPRV